MRVFQREMVQLKGKSSDVGAIDHGDDVRIEFLTQGI
jgi:hypothetical protein